MTSAATRTSLVIVLCLALTGCAQLVEQGTNRAGEALDELDRTIAEVGDTADALLARVEKILCDKRFSLRAYQARYGSGDRWDALVKFCRWDQTPRPGAPRQEGSPTSDANPGS